jgi:hypothetical protein
MNASERGVITAFWRLTAFSLPYAGQWLGDTEGDDCRAGGSALQLRTVHSQDIGSSLMGGICPWLLWMWLTETRCWLKAPLCAAVNQSYGQHGQCQSVVQNPKLQGPLIVLSHPFTVRQLFIKLYAYIQSKIHMASNRATLMVQGTMWLCM